MNTVMFAQLISYLSATTNTTFGSDQITAIKGTIEQMTTVKNDPATHEQIVAASAVQVKEMLYEMSQNRKIQAIKACRMLTGYGLKEAKDAVEFAMSPNVANTP